jgi:hypothetical protein
VSFWEFFIVLPPDSIVNTKRNTCHPPEAAFWLEAAEMKARGLYFCACDRQRAGFAISSNLWRIVVSAM